MPGVSKKCAHPGCGYTAVSASKMVAHFRSHTGERPFACDVPGCGYTAAESSKITSHMRIHTGERPYACEIGRAHV